MPLVVDDLILVADGRVAVFEDEILDAAVAARRDLPVDHELELFEGVLRDDVALAVRVFPVVRRKRERTVLRLPAGVRGIGFFVSAPPVERVTIEEQDPAGFFSASVSVFGAGLCG
jgi:hypothetical protein